MWEQDYFVKGNFECSDLNFVYLWVECQNVFNTV